LGFFCLIAPAPAYSCGFVVDASATTDYSAARSVLDLIDDLKQRGPSASGGSSRPCARRWRR
jgi:hypothetical protein